jgi:hypothetical protein
LSGKRALLEKEPSLPLLENDVKKLAEIKEKSEKIVLQKNKRKVK